MVSVDDPCADDVRELLRAHLAFTSAQSPPEDCHALGLDGLLEPAVTLFSCRDGRRLLGIGAPKRLDAVHAELKSMHTAREARRQGVGQAILEHILGVAHARGHRHLSLETGSMDGFGPARQLYAEHGFARQTLAEVLTDASEVALAARSITGDAHDHPGNKEEIEAVVQVIGEHRVAVATAHLVQAAARLRPHLQAQVTKTGTVNNIGKSMAGLAAVGVDTLTPPAPIA